MKLYLREKSSRSNRIYFVALRDEKNRRFVLLATPKEER